MLLMEERFEGRRTEFKDNPAKNVFTNYILGFENIGQRLSLFIFAVTILKVNILFYMPLFI